MPDLDQDRLEEAAAPTSTLTGPEPESGGGFSSPVPGLVVGSADDPLEAAADAAADHALARLRRQTAPDAHRHAPGCGHQGIRRSPGAAGGAVIGHEGGNLDPGTQRRIDSMRGGGKPLDPLLRSTMETAFGTTLPNLRIHTDTNAAALNRQISARAFTTGNDIFFGAGQYRPDTEDGAHTLAHEIAHTLQPGGGAHRSVQRAFTKDWQKSSKLGIGKSRSRKLKQIDSAVKRYAKLSGGGKATAAALESALQGILDAVDTWGKLGTSKRSAAVRNLVTSVTQELNRIAPPGSDGQATTNQQPQAPTSTPQVLQTLVGEIENEVAQQPDTDSPGSDSGSDSGSVATQPDPTDETPAVTQPDTTVDTGPDTTPDTGPDPTPDTATDTGTVPDPVTESTPGSGITDPTSSTDTAGGDGAGATTEVVPDAPTDAPQALVLPTPVVKTEQTSEEVAPDTETPEQQTERFEKAVLAGKNETHLKVTRAAFLDALERLPKDRFAHVAAILMLNADGGLVDHDGARVEALRILTVQLHDKSVARTLLDQNVTVVVIPRDKKMTDMVEFSTLKDTKTFDGRVWNEVRGSGGFKVPGKNLIYVAIAEENITGEDATGAAATTSFCYAKGYSTTSHEFAHVIDQFGLSDKDRKLVDQLYQAKHTLDATTPQEWADGFNVTTGKHDWQSASEAWKKSLPDTETDKDLLVSLMQQLAYRSTLAEAGATAHLAKLKSAKLINSAGTEILGPTGTVWGSISSAGAISWTGGPPLKKKECYASSHRLEYFAQSANAYLNTNAGNDPYTVAAWTGQGHPEKAARRNGKDEIKRIEPDLYPLLEKLFGKGADLTGANPRKK